MITIVKQPQLYAPVSNFHSYQITSDFDNLSYFIVEVLSSDGGLIAKLKFNVLPIYQNGSYFDLSPILQSYLDSELVGGNSFMAPVSKNLFAYKLKITEYSFDEAGDELITDTKYVFNGELSKVGFTTFDYHDYIVTPESGTARFLNNKPLVNPLYINSDEYLYFLNAGVEVKVRFDFYGRNSVLLGTHYISGITSDIKSGRINVNTRSLSNYFGDDFNYLYGDQFMDAFDLPFGDYYEVNSSNYFTVRLVDLLGNTKSETRTYQLKSSNCNRKHIQLYISNNLGGFDAVDLFNPVETVNVTKTTTKQYPYKLVDGIISNSLGGVYNDTTIVINKNNTSTYKAITDVLNDYQSKWLRDIVNAEKAYLKLSNGMFLPVSITNTSYTVKERRLSGNNIRVEAEFTSEESGLID